MFVQWIELKMTENSAFFVTIWPKVKRFATFHCISVKLAGIVDQEKKYREKVKCESAALPFPELNYKHKLVKWMED